MKVALVTTSASVRSGVGDYVRSLVPHLRELCELRLFAEPEAHRGEMEGVPLAPITALDPRAHDRLLFQLGNEPAHGYMPRAIKALGGTVMLHQWVLFDLACAAYPGLLRGGLRGYALALREGGLAQSRLYAWRLRESHGARAAGSGSLELALNRSVVRHADSFLVHDRILAERILVDRNARTPIGIVPHGAEASDAARSTIEHLEDFPGPRTTRRARIAFRSLWVARQKPPEECAT